MKTMHIPSRSVHIKTVRTEKLVGNVYTDSRCRRIRDIIYGYVVTFISYKQLIKFTFHIKLNSICIYCTIKLFI